MIHLKNVCLAVLVGSLPIQVFAQTTPPVAPPATMTPTAAAPVLDQSSPKALLRSFFASRGEIDEAATRSLLHATDPVEQQALDSVVMVEVANVRLRNAEKAKFGKATTAPAVNPQGMSGETMNDLDSFVETVQGDRAVISAQKVPALAMEFIRVDGKWKLPISSLVGKIDPAMAEAMGIAARAQVEIIDALTADVNAGKLSSEEQVRQELARRFAERLAAATKSGVSSATQPATSPGT